jgi:hypothetical protein
MDDVESVAESILGDETSNLDAILINTTLYKKAFKSRRKAQKQAFRDTKEVKETDFIVPETTFQLPDPPPNTGSTTDPESSNHQIGSFFP